MADFATQHLTGLNLRLRMSILCSCSDVHLSELKPNILDRKIVFLSNIFA